MVSIADLPKIRGQYREKVSIAKFCWFGVGGVVDVLYKPSDIEDLQEFIKELPREIPFFIFGVGSNLLLKEEGFRGVAIRLGGSFNHITLLENCAIKAGAAVLDFNLAEFACVNGVGSLDFFCGVPGTIGGALAMNAGAYGNDTSSVLISAKAVRRDGALLTLTNQEMEFNYRQCGAAHDHIFVEATFQGTIGVPEKIRANMLQIQSSRSAQQPIKSKTGGSTFKNPPGHSAWKLIDDAGCRGLKIGGAQVSELHCNFFINVDNATADDIITLVQTVKTMVYEHSNIMLQEEIKIL
jgi:UDP-N-acetylmuramate dehydrogenase